MVYSCVHTAVVDKKSMYNNTLVVFNNNTNWLHILIECQS